ncbi:carboxypeptidase-like regulatory domain-containing protein [Gemmatimonas sp.]|uniref:carboxypeptidase-like regulatory domain-containing protein n=1 Tax=Gemmatimonas sp. TaxID=1962908 RepID=UPI00356A568A
MTARVYVSVYGRRSVVLLAALVACGESRASNQTKKRMADVSATPGADHARAVPRDSGVLLLARAAGGVDGLQYTVSAQATSGFIVGKIGGSEPRDTSIAPTHDLSVCRPFTQSLVPSRDGGVGNSVVWLVGVTTGPRDDAPRRVRVVLDGCRLEPRVQRVAAGGTVMITSRDAMMTRLQFVDVGGASASRATVLFNDAGQVVPTSDAAKRPGLVQIRDDLHPWVRAYLAVTPHPFVAVTAADGTFRFDNVPPGTYTLVAWHERFGTKQQRVRVDAHVETRVDLSY